MNHLTTLPRQAAKWALRQTTMRDAVYRPNQEDRPFYIRLDVTNYCNQKCIKCWVPDAMARVPTHYMSIENYRIMAENVFAHTYMLQVPCAYEGLMHPNFTELIKIADSYHIPNIGVVTNGVLLKNERAEALLGSEHVTAVNISIDGMDPEIYRKMRGRSGPKGVLENVKAFLERKRAAGRKHPTLKFNVIIARSNAHDLPNIARWAVDHGVDEVEFFHIEPYQLDNEEWMLHEPERYRRLHDELGAIFKDSRTKLYLPRPFEQTDFDPATGEYTRRYTQNEQSSEYDTSESDTYDSRYSHPYPTDTLCINPWMVLQVDSHGDVRPCAHRCHLESLGNLVRQSRDEALNSYRYMKLRKNLLTGSLDSVCNQCKSRSPSADPLRRRPIRMLKEDLEKVEQPAPPLESTA